MLHKCMTCLHRQTFAAFGWLQSTFEGEEQSVAYTVQGGYSKGSGNIVDVFVDLVQDPEAKSHPSKFINSRVYMLRLKSFACVPGMADFGGNLLTSTTPISLHRPDFGNTNIPITLAEDNIGQEGTERGILRMRISEFSEQPLGSFFRRDLRVTINDTSSE